MRVRLRRMLDSAAFAAIKDKTPGGTMNASIRRITTMALLVFAASLADADSTVPSHSCHKPTKPAEIKTQQEADTFNEAVRRYKSCIEEFVRKQQDAATNHQRAATQAVTEWNEFVTNDMKQ